MIKKLNNFLAKIAYFRDKINSYRIYYYTDFNLTNPNVKDIFETWQQKYRAYKENKNNVIKTPTYQNILKELNKTKDSNIFIPNLDNLQDSNNLIDSQNLSNLENLKPKDTQNSQNLNTTSLQDSSKKTPSNLFIPNATLPQSPSAQTQNLDSNKYFKDYEIKVINELESLIPDSKYFAKSMAFLDKNYINLSLYQNNKFKRFSNAISNAFLKIFSLKIFSRNFCVLSPDFFKCAYINASKSELIKHNIDYFCLLNARAKNLIPAHFEHRFYVRDMQKENVDFQIFSVSKETLNDFSKKVKNNLYCLNPFEICANLYYFFPNLTHFTIIFQDMEHHALCHYSYGFLDFSVVVKKSVALQDYYANIDMIGCILYCDYSGDRAYVEDYVSLESCFNLPLDECLKILAFSHLRNKNVDSSFYPKDFYNMKFIVKMSFYIFVLIILLCIGSAAYREYEYNRFVKNENAQYEAEIENLISKKKNYSPMYDRIYENLEKKHSLNFLFRNDEK